MKNIYKLSFALLAFVSISCGGSDGSEEVIILNPSASTLKTPLKDTECQTGTVFSDTESDVPFEWNVAANATKYTVIVTNLNDKTTKQKDVSTNSTTFRLLRAVPYSWKVLSKSSTTTITATSDTWKFYNAGLGVTNYAPFPAEVVSPAIGSNTLKTVTLKWNTTDIDNDITKYEVYLGTTNPPTVLQATTTAQQIADLSLLANTIYYWKVVTTDSKNNSSTSPIFDFKTQ